WIGEASYSIGPFYSTNDDADHPVDITLEWAECSNGYASYCDLEAAALQPVITCADTTSTPAPVSASTCTSVTVSGVGDLDGTYEYKSSGYYTRIT
ncbi:unnamed protein product, partial [Pylaiella littoralis]